MADLNPVKGHEQAGLRPVVIMQNNILNPRLNTVVTIPLTTNMKIKGLMTTYFLEAKTAGINKDSIALLHHIRTVDKSRLIKKIGHVPPHNFMELRIRTTRIFW